MSTILRVNPIAMYSLQTTCLAAAVLFCGVLTGCGSGAVSSPPPPDPSTGTALSISPSTLELFPDVPTTFTILGGKPGYAVASSNNVALPVNATFSSNSFTVLARPVTADTPVDITVRDAANSSATAKATIKPGTLNSAITFQPGAPSATGCGVNAVCSGGDAQITVKAAQNGIVLRNRAIRFDAFQGEFQFITPGTNVPAKTLTISTDDQGEAVARLVASAGAATQVATFQTTDVVAGQFRRYNFNIVQQTSGAGILSTLPSATVTLKGAKGLTGQDGNCPAGLSARVDYYVFGGTPPYSIASPLPGVASVLPTIVASSGGSFSAQVNDCGKVAFIVSDATGRTTETAPIDAQRGDKGDAPIAPTAAAITDVSPKALSIDCSQSASVSVAGTGTFTATVVTGGVPAAGFSIIATNNAPGSVTFSRPKNTSNTSITLPNPIVVNIVGGTTIFPITITPTRTTCAPGT